jgi:hypothetical protein
MRGERERRVYKQGEVGVGGALLRPFPFLRALPKIKSVKKHFGIFGE